ncbi:MAG: flavin reductase family protein [bacterium]|nr:flavin reductase family protein [bacterium]
MAKIQKGVSEALFPVPIVLVSCADRNGKANMVTIAWTGVVCSSPAMVSISVRPSRFSHSMIKETNEFVLNIPGLSLIKETDLCGIISGRNKDKFKETGLTPVGASKVKVPLIEECPVNIECKVKQLINLGAHDMFLAEVVAVHYDEEVLDKNGNIDFSKAAPFTYNQGEYWSLGKKAGYYGFSARE